MGQIREVDYVVGIETSTPPTSGTPSVDADLVTKGFADATYTRLDNVAGSVATIAALRTLLSTAADRITNQIAIVVDTGYYAWDSTSTATDDGDTVVKPNDNPVTGRWLKASSGGGGGGAGSASIESLMQKLENEKYGIVTEDLDNSVGISAKFKPRQKDFVGYLLRSALGAGTSVQMVINPKFVNDSDKNLDSATGWTAIGAGASLTVTTTAGEFYVGTGALKFDKNGTGTYAAIQYDRGAQTLAVNLNTRVYAKVKLPSITNLTNIALRMYAGTTSDYREFTAALQADGSALVVGENTVYWDISSGGTPSGAGWTSAELSRYQDVGVNTSSAGQTYTGIIVDSLAFSYRYPEDLGIIGSRWTLHDNSNSESVIFSSSNTAHDGIVTLAAALSNTYAGGFDGASIALLKRSVMLIEDSVASFDNTLSGAAALTQSVRMASFARGTISGTAHSFVDAIAIQAYKTKTVGGSTIDVIDDADDHLNLKSGDIMEVQRPLKIEGKTKYYFLFARALTADATASGGITTLTMTTTSILPGDIICKRHLSSKSMSLVGIAPNNEAFASMTLENDPNGVQLIETGLPLPFPNYVWGDFALGGQNSSIALRNRLGVAPDLAISGTVNTSDTGPNGEYAASGFSADGDSLFISAGSSNDIGGASEDLTIFFWIKDITGFTGTARFLVGKDNIGGSVGWSASLGSVANKIEVITNAGVRSFLPYTVNQWTPVVLRLVNGSTLSKMWASGVNGGYFNTPITSASSNQFIIGDSETLNQPATGVLMSRAVIWRNAPEFSDDLVLSLSSGAGLKLIQRYLHKLAGQSGQKLSDEIVMTRSTVAVTPKIWKAGLEIS